MRSILGLMPSENARQREVGREQVSIGGRGNLRTVKLTGLYPLAASGLPFVAKATSLTRIPFTTFPVYRVTPALNIKRRSVSVTSVTTTPDPAACGPRRRDALLVEATRKRHERHERHERHHKRHEAYAFCISAGVEVSDRPAASPFRVIHQRARFVRFCLHPSFASSFEMARAETSASVSL